MPESTERERDMLIARWMGWTIVDAKERVGTTGSSKAYQAIPYYAFNSNDTFAMEEEIARHDWRGLYIEALKQVAYTSEKGIPEWFLLHATLEQRQRACYNMLKELGL